MKELFIKEVIDKTNDFLDNNQRIRLNKLLEKITNDYEIVKIINEKSKIEGNNEEIIKQFLSAKEIEGCSNRTLKYYEDIIYKTINCFR